jgi:hypothetical protein
LERILRRYIHISWTSQNIFGHIITGIDYREQRRGKCLIAYKPDTMKSIVPSAKFSSGASPPDNVDNETPADTEESRNEVAPVTSGRKGKPKTRTGCITCK